VRRGETLGQHGVFSHESLEQRVRRMVSAQHFSEGGKPIESVASLKSARPKITDTDWNVTHQSVTAPEAKLFCEGPSQAAKLYFTGHATSSHRHGLAADFTVGDVSTGERVVVLARVNCRRFPHLSLESVGMPRGYWVTLPNETRDLC
jgi:hypothetical protein